MTFKPRYGLLTLLVLTAVVALGVKLWYGPHHVIERPESHLEAEYTYTRDWSGNKLVHGPRVTRFLLPDGSIESVTVAFWRHGKDTSNFRFFDFSNTSSGHAALGSGFRPQPLTEKEQSAFQHAIAKERRGFQALEEPFEEYSPYRGD